MMGFGAWPLPLVRLLDLSSSAASILVAASIASEPASGRTTMVATALLFAFSPGCCVTMWIGSARMCALMSLAMLVAILFIDRWLAGDLTLSPPDHLLRALLLPRRLLAAHHDLRGRRARRLAVLRARGSATASGRRRSRSSGSSGCRSWCWQACSASCSPPAISPAPASVSGADDPFDFMMYLNGTTTAIGYTIGLPWKDIWPIVLVLVLLVLAPRWGASRIALYRLAIFAFPSCSRCCTPAMSAMPAITCRRWCAAADAGRDDRLRPGKAGLAADRGRDRLGGDARRKPMVRLCAGSRPARRPGGPVREMMARARGTTMLLDRDTGQAATDVAAARREVQAEGDTGSLRDPQARFFLLVDRFLGEDAPRRTPIVAAAISS